MCCIYLGRRMIYIQCMRTVFQHMSLLRSSQLPWDRLLMVRSWCRIRAGLVCHRHLEGCAGSPPAFFGAIRVRAANGDGNMVLVWGGICVAVVVSASSPGAEVLGLQGLGFLLQLESLRFRSRFLHLGAPCRGTRVTETHQERGWGYGGVGDGG